MLMDSTRGVAVGRLLVIIHRSLAITIDKLNIKKHKSSVVATVHHDFKYRIPNEKV